MDALSDVLKSVRLEGAVYLNAEFTAPWCVQAKYGLASVKERLAGAEQVVFFHSEHTENPLVDGARGIASCSSKALAPHTMSFSQCSPWVLCGLRVNVLSAPAADFAIESQAPSFSARSSSDAAATSTRIVGAVSPFPGPASSGRAT
jgi:hypothetical protein